MPASFGVSELFNFRILILIFMDLDFFVFQSVLFDYFHVNPLKFTLGGYFVTYGVN